MLHYIVKILSSIYLDNWEILVVGWFEELLMYMRLPFGIPYGIIIPIYILMCMSGMLAAVICESIHNHFPETDSIIAISLP